MPDAVASRKPPFSWKRDIGRQILAPGRPEPFPFRLNRNGASISLFDAFSSREPVPPDQIRGRLSLEKRFSGYG